MAENEQAVPMSISEEPTNLSGQTAAEVMDEQFLGVIDDIQSDLSELESRLTVDGAGVSAADLLVVVRSFQRLTQAIVNDLIPDTLVNEDQEFAPELPGAGTPIAADVDIERIEHGILKGGEWDGTVQKSEDEARETDTEEVKGVEEF